jgi:type II secretory pathway pseudopilin PulG
MRPRERGFSLVAAMSGIAIMMIMMTAAVPSWRYVMRNMREEELLFRGNQIAEAIERYQRKNGGAAPASLEDLVKGKFLRRAWGDPMTLDGKWRLLKPGEVGGMRFRRLRGRDRDAGPGGAGIGSGPGAGPGLGSGSDRLTPGLGSGVGGFVGVATTFEGEAFRIFNGQTKYDEWFFVAGQPRVVGRQQKLGAGAFPGAMPGLEGRPGVRGDKERPSQQRPQ